MRTCRPVKGLPCEGSTSVSSGMGRKRSMDSRRATFKSVLLIHSRRSRAGQPQRCLTCNQVDMKK